MPDKRAEPHGVLRNWVPPQEEHCSEPQAVMLLWQVHRAWNVHVIPPFLHRKASEWCPVSFGGTSQIASDIISTTYF